MMECPKCKSTEILEPSAGYPVYTCDNCAHDFVLSASERQNLNAVNALWARHVIVNSASVKKSDSRLFIKQGGRK